jgi:UDP-N-acetylmuramyl tripeptide synthase
VYNALVATATCLALGLPLPLIADGIAQVAAAFGRAERFAIGPHQAMMLLVKNPAGFNEVIRLAFPEGAQRHVVIAINDLLADGTDVSWLWDVDFERLVGRVARVVVTGIRAEDMALRLRYAGVDGQGAVVIEKGVGRALDVALAALPPGETLYILPTYTAMLLLKEELARRGIAPPWHEE